MALYMAPLATALGSTDGAVHVCASPPRYQRMAPYMYSHSPPRSDQRMALYICATAVIRKDKTVAISRDRTHSARSAHL